MSRLIHKEGARKSIVNEGACKETLIDGLKSADGKVKHQEIQRGSKAPCHSQVGRFGAQRTPPIPQKDDVVLVLVRRPAVETQALGASRARRAERLTLSTGSYATSTSASVATLGLTVLGPGEIFHPKSLKSVAERSLVFLKDLSCSSLGVYIFPPHE